MPHRIRVPRPRKLWLAAAVGAAALGAAGPAWASTLPAQPAAAPAAPSPAPSASPSPASPSPAASSAAAAKAQPAAAAKAAPAPAAAPAATQAQDPAGTHVVVAGDTLSLIAQRAGVTLGSVLAANALDPSSVIYPGEVLKLTGPPAQAAQAAPAPAPAPAAAPAPAPAARPAPPAAAPAPAPAPEPAAQVVYVAGSGGQAMVDRCIGPIHFSSLDPYALFVVEHDFCGGWAQFSGIQVGQKVTIAGYGTYTATARGQIRQGGNTDDVLAAFGHFHKAFLQTCIPGTSQMLLIALD